MEKPTFKQVDKFIENLTYILCIIALGYFIGRIFIYKTPITLTACLIWNSSEFLKMPLGKFAPTIFSLAIGSKGKRM